jgi:hypothetical protein
MTDSETLRRHVRDSFVRDTTGGEQEVVGRLVHPRGWALR